MISSKDENNQETTTKTNPFLVHEEEAGYDGTIRRNPFISIHSYSQEQDSNQCQNEQRYDLYKKQPLLSTAAVSLAQNSIDNFHKSLHDKKGAISNNTISHYSFEQRRVPVFESYESTYYDWKNQANTATLTKLPSSLLQNTYRYGSKSISRSLFNKENEEVTKAEDADEKEDEEFDDLGNDYLNEMLPSSVRRQMKILYKHYYQVIIEQLFSSSSPINNNSTTQMILIILLSYLLYSSSPSLLEPITSITEPPKWSWSSQYNHLNGRSCVMNYFIEQQPADEYDPDFKLLKTNEIKPIEYYNKNETYRTKGQMHVISRFISAVADSFRSFSNEEGQVLNQHLIFAGVRDGAHLAKHALVYWPHRGFDVKQTILHVLIEQESEMQGKEEEDGLNYAQLNKVEQNLKGVKNVLIYDEYGVAGREKEQDDDDFDDQGGMIIQDDEVRQVAKHLAKNNAQFNITSIIQPFAKKSQQVNIIPYLHIDGISFETQMALLKSAKKLLQQKTIIAIGIEHSPDLNVMELLTFFKSHKYKLFLLGSRQLARMDHLCPEILRDVLQHPSLHPPLPNQLQSLLHALGLIELKPHKWKLMEQSRRFHFDIKKFPPFFIAMVGQQHRQAMHIQHMYDLFGGYDSGAGQVKTANDRKAPGKK